MELDPQRALDYLKTVSRKPLEPLPLDVLLFGDYKLQGGEGYYSYMGTNPCFWSLYLDLYGIRELDFLWEKDGRWDLIWEKNWEKNEVGVFRKGGDVAKTLWEGGARNFNQFFRRLP